MYLKRLKTTFVQALQQTFDDDYPVVPLRGLKVSIEQPNRSQDFPSIWVDYSPQNPTKQVGISHVEYDTLGGMGRQFTRWEFQGHISFVVVAMTSLERDDIHDELIRTIAFGAEHEGTSHFRQFIRDQEHLNMDCKWSEISVRGMNTVVGTPWQTDDLIYECEVVLECHGDFVAAPVEGDYVLVPLSEIRHYAIPKGTPDPTNPNSGDWH